MANTSAAKARVDPNSPKNDAVKLSLKREEGVRRWWFITIIFGLTVGTFVSAYFFRDYANTLDGAAVSFLTSLIFTLFYVIIVEAAMSEAQRGVLDDEKEKVVNAVRSEIDSSLQSRLGPLLGDEIPIALVAEHGKQLLPVAFFPPTSKSNPAFQSRLGANLDSCRTYIFRGGSARHCPALLKSRKDRNLECRILILDPRAERAVLVHAKDRVWVHRNDPSEEQQSIDQKIRQIRDEIRQGITDLYALKSPFTIQVRTCADNLFYRSEIFDNEALVSFYTRDRETQNPPTYVYKANTFYYEAFLTDFDQSWEHPEKRFEITQHSTDADRNAVLSELGLI